MKKDLDGSAQGATPTPAASRDQELVARELLRIFQDDGMYERGEWEAFGPDTHDFLWGYAGRILSVLETAKRSGEQREPVQSPQSQIPSPPPSNGGTK